MINEQIRDKEVRVIGENGDQLGIMTAKEALKLAQEAELDLVCVAPNAKVPVCRLIDYKKFNKNIFKRIGLHIFTHTATANKLSVRHFVLHSGI